MCGEVEGGGSYEVSNLKKAVSMKITVKGSKRCNIEAKEGSQ